MPKPSEASEELISAAAERLVQEVLNSIEREGDKEDLVPNKEIEPGQPICHSPNRDSSHNKLTVSEKISEQSEISVDRVTTGVQVEQTDDKHRKVYVTELISTTDTSHLTSSTTNTLTIEDVTSVEELPLISAPTTLSGPIIGLIQPLAEFLTGPTMEISPMHFPLDQVAETANESRVYAPVRGIGVGATSPVSPHPSATLIDPFCSINTSIWQPWLDTQRLKAHGSKELKVITNVPRFIETATDVIHHPRQTNSKIATDSHIPSGSGSFKAETENAEEEQQNILDSEEIHRKIEPFTQTLPTYTPSRVYLRTITNNLPLYSNGLAHENSVNGKRHTANPHELHQKSTFRPDDVPRLVLPETPHVSQKPMKTMEEILSPCPVCPRFSHRSVKNVIPTGPSRPLRKKYSLSWWQPLNSADSSKFTLSEPNVKLVQQLIQEQTARDKRIADAIAFANRQAESQKAAKFQKIRQRAQRNSARRSKVLNKPGTKQEDVNARQNPIRPHSIRVSWTKKKDAPHDMQGNNNETNMKPETNQNKHPQYEHSVRLNVMRPGETRKRSDSVRLRSPDNRRPGMRSKSISRIIPQARKKLVAEHPVKRTLHKPRSSDRAELHSISVQTNEAKKELAQPTREPVRRKKVRRDLSERDGDPESRWRNSLRNNDSPVCLSKTIKPVSSRSLTRLRSRCHSMERELEQMDDEQHKPSTATTDDPHVDGRIEASFSSNQTLRKRLEELQRLQAERELALRKARHMVDTLIYKQQMQADMIRNNTDSLRELGASAWSLTSPKPWNIDSDAEGMKDTSREHWTQYPEPMNAMTRDLTNGKSTDDWNINMTPSSRRRWTSRVQQMDSQVVSTHKVLDRLRDDYAELARNVSRIEQKTREAAASVHTLMGQYTGSESPKRTVSSTNSYSPQSDHRHGLWVDPSVESRLQNARTTLDTIYNDPLRYSYTGPSDYGRGYPSASLYREHSGAPGVNVFRTSWTRIP